MKKIKRTTIKIRRRELIVIGSGGQNYEANVQRCPACHFPIPSHGSFEIDEKPPRQLQESNENYPK